MTSQQVIVRQLFYARWRSSNSDPHCSMLALDQKTGSAFSRQKRGTTVSQNLPLHPSPTPAAALP